MGIMAWLGDIIRNILVIAVLTMFLEILLPGGAAKKYSKFVMGLLVLVVIINPILSIFSQGIPNLSVPSLDNKSYNTAEIVSAGQALNSKMTAEGEAYYKESLVKQIKSLLKLVDGVESAAVEVYLNEGHNLNNLIIVLNIAEQSTNISGQPPNSTQQNELIKAIREKVEVIIGDFYDIPADKIQVSISTLAD